MQALWRSHRSFRGRFVGNPGSCPAAPEALEKRDTPGYNRAFAGVAQLVEQLIRNEKVGCSIHLSGTKYSLNSLL
jgi:hypothetical protein